MKVCYFGTYRANYSRNQILIASLRTAGIEVVECHVPLWKSIEDRVNIASGGWASLAFISRVISIYIKLIKKYAALDKTYDLMILGYPGQLDVILARLLTWLHQKPLVLDLFMSIYLVAIERGIHFKSKVSVKLLYALEWFVCRLPDLLLCDTQAYLNWHNQTYGLDKNRFRLVPTGADDRVFTPLLIEKSNNGQSKVLYYGTYIPNHGIETIIEAAKILKAYPEIVFELVGEGPTKDHARNLANKYALNNIIFTGWVEKNCLPQKIANADLILGAFGTTPQSLMTIQNKIYEGLAMGKPIITGDSPAVSQNLTHKKSAYLIERTDSQALANGILDLHKNPTLREALGKQGRLLFEEKYSIIKLGLQLKEHLMELLKRR